MAGFQVTIKRERKLTPDVRRVLIQTHENAVGTWRTAVRIFVEELAKEVSRHQETGMSYASLFHISQIVKASMPALDPKTPQGLKGFKSITGSYYPNRRRDVATGMALGEKTAKIGFGSPTNPRYNFTFEIQVYQYLIHEFGLGINQGSPWGSILKAKVAMDDFLKTNARFFVPSLSNLFRETGTGLRAPIGTVL